QGAAAAPAAAAPAAAAAAATAPEGDPPSEAADELAQFGMTTVLTADAAGRVQCVAGRLPSDHIVQEIDGCGAVRLLTVDEAKAEDARIKNALNKPIVTDAVRPTFVTSDLIDLCDEVYERRRPLAMLRVGNVSEEEIKAIHTCIRIRYSGELKSQEKKENGASVIFVKRDERVMRSVKLPRTQPYMHFTLAREDVSMHEALDELRRIVKLDVNETFFHRLTEEPGGVCVQRVSTPARSECLLLHADWIGASLIDWRVTSTWAMRRPRGCGRCSCGRQMSSGGC
ncbi:hypothetical protein PFISCL1PPCAC_17076, partial [Pristionchus fissidentatus]